MSRMGIRSSQRSSSSPARSFASFTACSRCQGLKRPAFYRGRGTDGRIAFMAGDRREDATDNGSPRPGGLSDMMKKALFAGIGAVFMTEESVRAYVSESKLPRELAQYVIKNTGQ